MGIVVGGERAWRVFRKGDIAVALHWINGEPAMVLFPVALTDSRLARSGGQTGSVMPFVLPLAVLHEYVGADGHPHYLRALQGAQMAARCLGMAPEMSVLHRIIDAIVDAAADLVAMPPEPTALVREREEAGEVMGELTLRDGEDIIMATEVRSGQLQEALINGQG